MDNLWQNCLEKLKKTLGEISFDTWVAPLHLKSLKDSKIELEAPDMFFKNWIESNYLHQISQCLKDISGKEFELSLEVNPSLLKRKTNKIFKSMGKTFKEEPQDSIRLNARFTFDKFIVGASNRMAHAASVAVSTAPGKSYNPLFLYGGVGLGKTHLMQGIAHEVLKRTPQTKIKYTSSERFTNELIASIQNRTTNKFRQKYRNIDVLIIDDIQFLSGKEAIQEEFFHTFNVLYDYHKQIIISSDRSPREIPRLEERLSSRFSWGLVVDIQPPDFETRVAILQKKLENEPVSLDIDILSFIAKHITTNIRELEGALIRIIAYSLIEQKEITLPLVKDILKDVLKEIDKQITPDFIMEKVAETFSISSSDLKKAKRSKSLLFPRQVFMHLLREHTDLSLPEIGVLVGAKHHTTVLYALRKLQETLKKDERSKNIVDRLSQEFKQV